MLGTNTVERMAPERGLGGSRSDRSPSELAEQQSGHGWLSDGARGARRLRRRPRRRAEADAELRRGGARGDRRHEAHGRRSGDRGARPTERLWRRTRSPAATASSARSRSRICRRATSSRAASSPRVTPRTRGCSCRFPSNAPERSTDARTRRDRRRARDLLGRRQRRHRSCVARGAEVRRVDNGSTNALTTSDNTVLVLAVDNRDTALAVAHASQAGKITIVRADGAHDGANVVELSTSARLTMARSDRYVVLGTRTCAVGVVQ